MIIRSLIKQSEEACENAGVNSNFARFLMLELLKENNIDMYLNMEENLDASIEKDFLEKLERVCNDEPLAYVLGYHWFYGYKIKVNKNVLIPRQETEELVAYLLDYAEFIYDKPTIVDVACGSGAIGLALSKELNTRVVSTDISEAALQIAKENADNLSADMVFYEGDMLEPLIENGLHFDMLICNPPYIKQNEVIQKSVYDFEPHVALFGGEDGLFFYQKVLEKAHLVLNPNGLIAFEIGYDIGEGVVNLARKYFPQSQIRLVKDMNGLDRFVFVHMVKTKRIHKEDKDKVIHLLKEGKAVAIPTDTVYGLAMRSDDPILYDTLRQIKERPENKPFPLMVSSIEQLASLVDLTDRDRALVNEFMPGAITFIFNKKKGVFSFLGEQETLGIRMADDPWVMEIIDGLGVPIWLPSANVSNQPTGTTSDEVLAQLDGKIEGVVLGESGQKASSSVFDLTKHEIVELRKGPISLETLQNYLENL